MQVEQEYLVRDDEDFELDINYTQNRGIFYLETSLKNAEILVRELSGQTKRLFCEKVGGGVDLIF